MTITCTKGEIFAIYKHVAGYQPTALVTIVTIDFTVHVYLSHEQSRCHKEGVNQLMLHALHCNTLSC